MGSPRRPGSGANYNFLGCLGRGNPHNLNAEPENAGDSGAGRCGRGGRNTPCRAPTITDWDALGRAEVLIFSVCQCLIVLILAPCL